MTASLIVDLEYSGENGRIGDQFCTSYALEKYPDYAQKLTDALQTNLSDCHVRHNPGPGKGFAPYVIPGCSEQPGMFLNRITAQKVRYPRFGAFEVEVEFPKTEKKVVLHSKLQSRRWPNVDELARLIRVLGERIDDGEGLADLLARHEEQLALLEQSAPKKPKRKRPVATWSPRGPPTGGTGGTGEDTAEGGTGAAQRAPSVPTMRTGTSQSSTRATSVQSARRPVTSDAKPKSAAKASPRDRPKPSPRPRPTPRPPGKEAESVSSSRMEDELDHLREASAKSVEELHDEFVRRAMADANLPYEAAPAAAQPAPAAKAAAAKATAPVAKATAPAAKATTPAAKATAPVAKATTPRASTKSLQGKAAPKAAASAKAAAAPKAPVTPKQSAARDTAVSNGAADSAGAPAQPAAAADAAPAETVPLPPPAAPAAAEEAQAKAAAAAVAGVAEVAAAAAIAADAAGEEIAVPVAAVDPAASTAAAPREADEPPAFPAAAEAPAAGADQAVELFEPADPWPPRVDEPKAAATRPPFELWKPPVEEEDPEPRSAFKYGRSPTPDEYDEAFEESEASPLAPPPPGAGQDPASGAAPSPLAWNGGAELAYEPPDAFEEPDSAHEAGDVVQAALLGFGPSEASGELARPGTSAGGGRAVEWDTDVASAERHALSGELAASRPMSQSGSGSVGRRSSGRAPKAEDDPFPMPKPISSPSPDYGSDFEEGHTPGYPDDGQGSARRPSQGAYNAGGGFDGGGMEQMDPGRGIYTPSDERSAADDDERLSDVAPYPAPDAAAFDVGGTEPDRSPVRFETDYEDDYRDVYGNDEDEYGNEDIPMNDYDDDYEASPTSNTYPAADATPAARAYVDEQDFNDDFEPMDDVEQRPVVSTVSHSSYAAVRDPSDSGSSEVDNVSSQVQSDADLASPAGGGPGPPGAGEPAPVPAQEEVGTDFGDEFSDFEPE